VAQKEKRTALAVVLLRWLAPEARAMHVVPDVVVLRIWTALFEGLLCGCPACHGSNGGFAGDGNAGLDSSFSRLAVP
jgi:hypothetical protein